MANRRIGSVAGVDTLYANTVNAPPLGHGADGATVSVSFMSAIVRKEKSRVPDGSETRREEG